jgi:hypothetical protein
MLGKKNQDFFKNNIISSRVGILPKKKRGAYEWVATKIDPTYGKCGPF